MWLAIEAQSEYDSHNFDSDDENQRGLLHAESSDMMEQNIL